MHLSSKKQSAYLEEEEVVGRHEGRDVVEVRTGAVVDDGYFQQDVCVQVEQLQVGESPRWGQVSDV